MLKYKFNTNSLTEDIKINVSLDSDREQTHINDLVSTKFIEVNKEKSINGVIDYEKVNYEPVNKVKQIKFNINKTYSEFEFEQSDIKLRRNNFKNTFLQLKFYDSPSVSPTGNLLYIKNIYTNYDVNNIDVEDKVSFCIENPENINKVNYSDGYNFIYFKDIINNGPFTLYMRATLNNAKNGTIKQLFTKEYNVDDYNNYYTVFNLKKIQENYLYDIIGAHVLPSAENYIINLVV